MIELYSDATPNGLKISIALEELGLEYKVHRVYLGGDQFTESFTKMNPNNKIPVIVDNGYTLSESSAILVYLAEKTGQLLPKDINRRSNALEMLMFQTASFGPMFGQYLVFAAAWQNKFPDVTKRYLLEVSRLMKVLDKRLEGKSFMAGDEYTIADIAFLPWVRLCVVHPLGGDLPLQENKNLLSWWERASSREAVKKGFSNPPPFPAEQQFEAFVKATVGLGRLAV